MKGYYTTEVDKEFCGTNFKAGEKYHIIKEREGYIVVRGKNHSEEQLMTKLWIKKGMFNFLTYHEE